MMQLGSPTIPYGAGSVNVVCDGNSLTAGDGSSNGQTMPELLSGLSPLNGGITVTNVGVGGQTTRSMNGLDGGSTADVDGAFNGSKLFNVLFAWEITNSVQAGGRSGAQAVDDLNDYCTARKATHPSWRIVLVGTLPRYQTNIGPGVAAVNQELLIANNLMRQNYRQMGADAFLDLRVPGGPFDLPDFNQATFDRAQTQPYWSTVEVDPTYRVHLNSLPGYLYIATQYAGALRRLKK